MGSDTKNVINVTRFDLAVMEIVETIAATKGIHKKQILEDIDIPVTAWAKMLRNQRNVSTKPSRQSEIISVLKGKYDVDTNYIYNYPNHLTMFLSDHQVEDDGGLFKIPKHGSIISLKKSITYCEKIINEMMGKQDELVKRLERTQKDLENALLLIDLLRKNGQEPGQIIEKPETKSIE